jgi:hypothetical protein
MDSFAVFFNITSIEGNTSVENMFICNRSDAFEKKYVSDLLNFMVNRICCNFIPSYLEDKLIMNL